MSVGVHTFGCSFPDRTSNDYKLIEIAPGRPLTPADTNAFHARDRDWLISELDTCKSRGERAIVMTHFCPLPYLNMKCLLLNGTLAFISQAPLAPQNCSAYGTDLRYIMKRFGSSAYGGSDTLQAWFYGHTHESNAGQAPFAMCVLKPSFSGRQWCLRRLEPGWHTWFSD